MKQVVPAILSDILDEVSAGTLLKHRSGTRAIVIDFALDGSVICARCKKKFLDEETLPSKPKHYELFSIASDAGDWIVLKLGSDECLVE